MQNVSTYYTPEEVKALSERVHNNARDKGWWKDKLEQVDGRVYLHLLPVDYSEKMVLIASEVMEAFEEYRKPEIGITQIYYKDGKPEGFPIEMADAFIRVLDLMGALMSSGYDFSLEQSPPIAIRHLGPDVGGHCFQILKVVTRCYDYVETDRFEPAFLPSILQAVEQACLDLEVNLVEAVGLKATYNESRPYRHGGKRA